MYDLDLAEKNEAMIPKFRIVIIRNLVITVDNRECKHTYD